MSWASPSASPQSSSVKGVLTASQAGSSENMLRKCSWHLIGPTGLLLGKTFFLQSRVSVLP